MKQYIKLVFFVASVFISLWAIAEKDTLELRIKPVGSLCMEGDVCASAQTMTLASAGTRSGEDIYNTKCAACHASGAAGAPRMGDVAAWEGRLEKGIEALYASAIGGIGGMPAGGLCGPSGCSEDEIKAAVDHMLVKTK